MNAEAPWALRDLSVELREGPELSIRADSDQLEQLLINLLRNAVDAALETGGGVSLGWERPAGARELLVNVEDEGPGIPACELDAIFEPFSQQDPSIHGRYGGSGLGLAITQGLLDALGGTVSVESTVGVGSTFTVTLPEVEISTEAFGTSRTGRRAAGVGPGEYPESGTVELPDPDEPRTLDALRQRLGPESLDRLQRLFTVKMIDELSQVAGEVRDAATEVGPLHVAALSAELGNAADRFDVQRIDEITLLLEGQLFGNEEGAGG